MNNPKSILLLLTIPLASCGRFVSSSTPRLTEYDGVAFLKQVVDQKGYQQWGSSSGGGQSPESSVHDFSVVFEAPDGDARYDVMQKLYDDMRRYVKSNGYTHTQRAISGTGQPAQISAFSFSFRRSGSGGIVRVISWVDTNGYITIDGFIYEHN